MEGLRDLQADSLAWLQLKIPSQGQHPQGSEQRVELGAGKGRLSRELLGVLDGPAALQPSLPTAPRCSSALWAAWAEHPPGRRELLTIGKQREAWFKIALVVSPVPASVPAKSVKNQLIQLRIQKRVCGGVCV